MEKRRVTCARCGSKLAQPATGRPRVYCSPLCRRDAEYRLRRLQSHLARAERALVSARLDLAAKWERTSTQKKLEFWQSEVEALGVELRAALADLAVDDEGEG